MIMDGKGRPCTSIMDCCCVTEKTPNSSVSLDKSQVNDKDRTMPDKTEFTQGMPMNQACPEAKHVRRDDDISKMDANNQSSVSDDVNGDNITPAIAHRAVEDGSTWTEGIADSAGKDEQGLIHNRNYSHEENKAPANDNMGDNGSTSNLENETGSDKGYTDDSSHHLFEALKSTGSETKYLPKAYANVNQAAMQDVGFLRTQEIVDENNNESDLESEHADTTPQPPARDPNDDSRPSSSDTTSPPVSLRSSTSRGPLRVSGRPPIPPRPPVMDAGLADDFNDGDEEGLFFATITPDMQETVPDLTPRELLVQAMRGGSTALFGTSAIEHGGRGSEVDPETIHPYQTPPTDLGTPTRLPTPPHSSNDNDAESSALGPDVPNPSTVTLYTTITSDDESDVTGSTVVRQPLGVRVEHDAITPYHQIMMMSETQNNNVTAAIETSHHVTPPLPPLNMETHSMSSSTDNHQTTTNVVISVTPRGNSRIGEEDPLDFDDDEVDELDDSSDPIENEESRSGGPETAVETAHSQEQELADAESQRLASAENDFQSIEVRRNSSSPVIGPRERTDKDADALLEQIISGHTERGMGPNDALSSQAESHAPTTCLYRPNTGLEFPEDVHKKQRRTTRCAHNDSSTTHSLTAPEHSLSDCMQVENADETSHGIPEINTSSDSHGTSQMALTDPLDDSSEVDTSLHPPQGETHSHQSCQKQGSLGVQGEENACLTESQGTANDRDESGSSAHDLDSFECSKDNVANTNANLMKTSSMTHSNLLYTLPEESHQEESADKLKSSARPVTANPETNDAKLPEGENKDTEKHIAAADTKDGKESYAAIELAEPVDTKGSKVARTTSQQESKDHDLSPLPHTTDQKEIKTPCNPQQFIPLALDSLSTHQRSPKATAADEEMVVHETSCHLNDTHSNACPDSLRQADGQDTLLDLVGDDASCLEHIHSCDSYLASAQPAETHTGISNSLVCESAGSLEKEPVPKLQLLSEEENGGAPCVEFDCTSQQGEHPSPPRSVRDDKRRGVCAQVLRTNQVGKEDNFTSTNLRGCEDKCSDADNNVTDNKSAKTSDFVEPGNGLLSGESQRERCDKFSHDNKTELNHATKNSPIDGNTVDVDKEFKVEAENVDPTDLKVNGVFTKCQEEPVSKVLVASADTTIEGKQIYEASKVFAEKLAEEHVISNVNDHIDMLGDAEMLQDPSSNGNISEEENKTGDYSKITTVHVLHVEGGGNEAEASDAKTDIYNTGSALNEHPITNTNPSDANTGTSNFEKSDATESPTSEICQTDTKAHRTIFGEKTEIPAPTDNMLGQISSTDETEERVNTVPFINNREGNLTDKDSSEKIGAQNNTDTASVDVSGNGLSIKTNQREEAGAMETYTHISICGINACKMEENTNPEINDESCNNEPVTTDATEIHDAEGNHTIYHVQNISTNGTGAVEFTSPSCPKTTEGSEHPEGINICYTTGDVWTASTSSEIKDTINNDLERSAQNDSFVKMCDSDKNMPANYVFATSIERDTGDGDNNAADQKNSHGERELQTRKPLSTLGIMEENSLFSDSTSNQAFPQERNIPIMNMSEKVHHTSFADIVHEDTPYISDDVSNEVARCNVHREVKAGSPTLHFSPQIHDEPMMQNSHNTTSDLEELPSILPENVVQTNASEDIKESVDETNTCVDRQNLAGMSAHGTNHTNACDETTKVMEREHSIEMENGDMIESPREDPSVRDIAGEKNTKASEEIREASNKISVNEDKVNQPERPGSSTSSARKDHDCSAEAQTGHYKGQEYQQADMKTGDDRPGSGDSSQNSSEDERHLDEREYSNTSLEKLDNKIEDGVANDNSKKDDDDVGKSDSESNRSISPDDTNGEGTHGAGARNHSYEEHISPTSSVSRESNSKDGTSSRTRSSISHSDSESSSVHKKEENTSDSSRTTSSGESSPAHEDTKDSSQEGNTMIRAPTPGSNTTTEKVILEATDMWLKKISDFCKSPTVLSDSRSDAKLHKFTAECKSQILSISKVKCGGSASAHNADSHTADGAEKIELPASPLKHNGAQDHNAAVSPKSSSPEKPKLKPGHVAGTRARLAKPNTRLNSGATAVGLPRDLAAAPSGRHQRVHGAAEKLTDTTVKGSGDECRPSTNTATSARAQPGGDSLDRPTSLTEHAAVSQPDKLSTPGRCPANRFGRRLKLETKHGAAGDVSVTAGGLTPKPPPAPPHPPHGRPDLKGAAEPKQTHADATTPDSRKSTKVASPCSRQLPRRPSRHGARADSPSDNRQGPSIEREKMAAPTLTKRYRPPKVMTVKEFEKKQQKRHLSQDFRRISKTGPSVDCHMNAYVMGRAKASVEKRRANNNYHSLIALENCRFLHVLKYTKSVYHSQNGQTGPQHPGSTRRARPPAGQPHQLGSHQDSDLHQLRRHPVTPGGTAPAASAWLGSPPDTYIQTKMKVNPPHPLGLARKV